MNCKELNTELEIITLEFEDGRSEDCFVAGLYEIEGKKYLSVAVGADENSTLENGELEGYLYQYVEMDDGEFELIDIERDDEFNRIAGIIDAYDYSL